MKKLFAIFMMTVLLLSVAACGDRYGDDTPVDTSKSQLYVGTYDGGLKTAWITKAAARFEALYADTEFEPGKKGVEIIITPNKNYGGTTFRSDILSSREEVFFIELSDYYELMTYDQTNRLLDITDAVTTPLTEYGESKSIEDKMYASDVSFFKTSEGKYYGLPFYEATYGIFYDVELFEQQNFYFAADGTSFVTSASDTRSNGPDGIAGTSDDGLPATYADFYKLCDRMVANGVVPLNWAGSVKNGTTNFLMLSLWADYEGAEQMQLNYSFNGTATNLVSSFGATGPATETVEIGYSNGYELQRQAGKYYSLEFMENILSNSSYYIASDTFSTGYDQITAQTDFLKGRYDTTGQRDVYGMYVDGTWWFNEAERAFQDLESSPTGNKQARKVAIMPLPKATADNLGSYTYMNSYLTECVIKSNIASSKVDLAKAFLRFVHTDESLSEFTVTTNVTRPFEYELTESDEANMTYYLKSIWEVHQNSDIVVPYSANNLYLSNVNNFLRADGFYASRVGNTNYLYYLEAFRAQSSISAQDYFNGCATRWSKEAWDNAYSRFYS